MTSLEDIANASVLFQEWVSAVKDKSRLQSDKEGLEALCSVLRCLRERMTSGQVLSFAGALPPLPRGIFIEGWRPAHELPSGAATTFVRDVFDDLSYQHVPDSIVADVFAVLADRSGPSAARMMQDQLPDSLRSLWP